MRVLPFFFMRAKKNWRVYCRLTLKYIFFIQILILCGLLFLSSDGDVNLQHVSEFPSRMFFLGTDSLGRGLLNRLGMCVLTLLKIWFYCLLSGFFSGLCSVYFLTFPIGRLFLTLVPPLIQGVPFLVWVLLGSYWIGSFDFFSVCFVSCLFFSISCANAVMQLYKVDSGLGYWEGSRVLGSTVWQKAWSHGVLRQWKDPLLLHVCQLLQRISIVEVSLSYLGLGVQEPQSSFGNMIALQFPGLLRGEWWAMCVILGTMIISLNVPMGFVTMSRDYKLL